MVSFNNCSIKINNLSTNRIIQIYNLNHLKKKLNIITLEIILN